MIVVKLPNLAAYVRGRCHLSRDSLLVLAMWHRRYKCCAHFHLPASLVALPLGMVELAMPDYKAASNCSSNCYSPSMFPLP